MVGGRPTGWCRCAAGPAPLKVAFVPTYHERTVGSFGADQHRIDNVEQISCRVFKPLEERFELTLTVK